MDSRPVERFFYRILFLAIGEKIFEPAELGRGFVADQDTLIPAASELLFPVDQSSHLTGDVRIRETHEVGKLFGIVGCEQEMIVVREDDGEVHPIP